MNRIPNAYTLSNQAILLTRQGNYKEAIACIHEALKSDQENSFLWFNLGITYHQNGELTHAINAMSKAIEFNPEFEEAIEALSTFCFENKDLERALFHSLQGLEINNLNFHFWNIQGVVLFNLGFYPEAAEKFERAVSLNPNSEDVLINLRDTYEILKNTAGKDECQKHLDQLKRK